MTPPKHLTVDLGGLVVGPDDVLVIVMPEKTPDGFGEEVREALNELGLAGRSLVIRGEAKLATVSR